jgi:two-component system, chemotaxis family, protein-glutamate methylesterase/glutaminase
MRAENTRLTCPECGGAVQRVQEDSGPTQYRCRIGHLYSPKTALAVHAEREENTLWSVVVLLEEGAELAEEIVKQPGTKHLETLRTIAMAKRRLAEVIKSVVSEFSEIPMVSNELESNE